jgi:putative hydrolase of HD superfamily
MKKLTELITYFQAIDKFDDMKRYDSQHKSVWQRNPAHCYNLGIIADYLMEALHLDLDYKKVRQLIDHHDLCELGWRRDYEAEHTHKNPNYGAEKALLERRNIEKLSQRFNNPKMKELWEEYNNGETKEAKFVRAVDKIESANHKLARNYNKIGAFTATYPNEFVKQCEELLPFWQEFQKYMAQKYAERGEEWKSEYNIDAEKTANEAI